MNIHPIGSLCGHLYFHHTDGEWYNNLGTQLWGMDLSLTVNTFLTDTDTAVFVAKSCRESRPFLVQF